MSTGAQDDLQKVTKLAYTMIVELGMSEAVGNMSFPLIDPAEFQKRSYSNKLSSLIDEVCDLSLAMYNPEICDPCVTVHFRR